MADDQPEPAPPPAPSPAVAARPGHDPARARFWFIAGHRLIGAVLVMIGMLAMQGALDWGKNLGKVLAVAGLITFFIMPLVFARMWKSIPK